MLAAKSAAGCRSAVSTRSSRPFVQSVVPPARLAVSRRQQQQQPREVVVHFFRFGKNGLNAQDAYSFVGSTNREQFTKEEVEDYFNYMGCLAAEGNYDRMDELMATDLHPIDVILLLAAQENDFPKLEEILNAGANPHIRGPHGKQPIELATKPEVLRILQEFMEKTKATV